MGTSANGIVTLLTDFGAADWYVGAVKGVILSRCPSCRLVDLSHEIPPGQVFAAALVLMNAYAYFPAGTVHLAVVDPGVGGERRELMVGTAKHWFVGPDNGLFDLVLDREEGGVVRVIERSDLFLSPRSRTFDGRDVFAPVAAFLAAGGSPDSLGPEIEDRVRLAVSRPRWGRGAVRGEIVYVDRFGNGITNLSQGELMRELGEAEMEVQVGDCKIMGIHGSYVDVPPGRPLALFGSSGFLEIAVHGGDAQALLGFGLETPVRVLKRRA